MGAGVETIDVDMKNERVVVVGSVDPKVIVKKLAKVGKKVEMPGARGGGKIAGGAGDHSYGGPNNEQSHDHFGLKGKGKNPSKGNGNGNGGRGKLGSAVTMANGDSGDDDDGGNEILQGDQYAHFFSDENANSCRLM